MSSNNNIHRFLEKAVIYEVNTRQFTHQGDFASFQTHLPRLQAMGVDLLWFMPIHPIGKHNRKGTLGSYYSSKDFFDINPEYGTKEDFKTLVESAHKLGMKVIMDWVANHAAWDNLWTISNPAYFAKATEGAFLSPYDWSDVIQIDHQNEAAHDAMRQAMLYWVKTFNIDGFRADLAHLTPLHFWIQAKEEAEAIKPGLIWLAETEDHSYHEVFDIRYAWKWMHLTATVIQEKKPVQTLIAMLKETTSQKANEMQLYFTSNHDENSWNGTEYEKYGIYAEALAVFSFIYPDAVPLIYSGQEIPNRQRLPFFDKASLNWQAGVELHEFYRKLAFCRKQLPASRSCEFIQSADQLLAFKRGRDEEAIIVFLNLDEKDIQCMYSPGTAIGWYIDVFADKRVELKEHFEVNLPPGGYLVLQRSEY